MQAKLGGNTWNSKMFYNEKYPKGKIRKEVIETGILSISETLSR